MRAHARHRPAVAAVRVAVSCKCPAGWAEIPLARVETPCPALRDQRPAELRAVVPEQRVLVVLRGGPGAVLRVPRIGRVRREPRARLVRDCAPAAPSQRAEARRRAVCERAHRTDTRQLAASLYPQAAVSNTASSRTADGCPARRRRRKEPPRRFLDPPRWTSTWRRAARTRPKPCCRPP